MSTEKLKFKTYRVRIAELDKGWKVYMPNQEPAVINTAYEALKYVKDIAQSEADKGVSSIQVIEWETITTIGYQVVKAIQ